MTSPSNDIKQKVGTMIREARKAKGLTQEELGQRLNVQRAAVNGYERGKQNLTIQTLQSIAEALDMPLKISLG